MADFNPQDFHIDSFITTLLIGYRPQGMIGPEVFPVVPVAKQSNVFAKIDKGNWFRQPQTLRAPGTAPKEVRYTVSSDTYFARNYELSTVVPWETTDNADPPHEPAVRAGEFLLDQLNLDYEIRLQNAVVNGCGSSQSLTGAAAWSNFAGSDPLTNVETGMESIRGTTGINPNRMVIPWKVWLKLRRHPDIVRAVFPGAGVGGVATEQQVAALFGIDRVLIPRAIRVTNPEGITPDTFADVWSTNVILYYAAPAPGVMVTTFGSTFLWTGANIGNNQPANFTVMRRQNPKIKSEEMQTGYYQDEKIVAPELGFLIGTGIN